MNARELLARNLNAMLVNGSTEIVSTGVKITREPETMYALYKKDLVRYASEDDYKFGYDSEAMYDMVTLYDGDYTYTDIIGLYPDITTARREYNRRKVNAFIMDCGLLVSRVMWIEEVNTDRTGNITEYLGTWNYKAAPLYPTIGA